MKILHISDGWESWNGAANIARMIAQEQARAGHEVAFGRWAAIRELRAADEVWVHCGWMPCLWWAAWWGRKVKWMPEACYDPMRLRFHAWKKWPVGFIERFFLRRCDTLVATCTAEAGWIRAYLGKRCPKIAIEDIKRFFNLNPATPTPTPTSSPLHVLYLGRRHPLKGVAYLEQAVKEVARTRSIELRIVSDHHGEALERDWAWCDMLCLPTLSENFGLVIAEALERGKRVLTTDGAPAWAPEDPSNNTPDNRLTYLRGYRESCDKERVALLVSALKG